jgi:hypothetical protein
MHLATMRACQETAVAIVSQRSGCSQALSVVKNAAMLMSGAGMAPSRRVS